MLTLGDIISEEARVYIKPEWGVLTEKWPAISFTHEATCRELRQNFRMTRDLMISVGTKNIEVEPHLRSKLLSASRFAANEIHETRKLVPPDVWTAAAEKYPERWEYGFAVTELWDFAPPVNVYDVLPEAYRKFAVHRGKPILLSREETQNVLPLGLAVRSIPVPAGAEVSASISRQLFGEAPLGLKQEIARAIRNIVLKSGRGGEEITRVMPDYICPSEQDLTVMAHQALKAQKGLCALCGQPVPQNKPANDLFKLSLDRIDSVNKAYSQDNIQITHYACNLAKNAYTNAQYQEWLSLIKGGAGHE